MIKNITFNHILTFLFLSCLFALILAYVSQYVFDLKPCILCLYQRKPFFIILFLAITGLLLKKEKAKEIIIFLAILLLFSNILIASYHVGVEHKIFAGPTNCTNISDFPDNLEELAKTLKNTKVVRCDKSVFIFLKISMAGWNLLYCLFMAILTIVAFNRVRKKNA